MNDLASAFDPYAPKAPALAGPLRKAVVGEQIVPVSFIVRVVGGEELAAARAKDVTALFGSRKVTLTF